MVEGARICQKCQRVCGPHQPDPCLGELPGVVGACCGHGNRDEAFIGWADAGPTIRGFWVDEEWRATVIAARETLDAESVRVSFEVRREALDGDLTDDDLVALGRFVIDIAQDRAPTFSRLVFK